MKNKNDFFLQNIKRMNYDEVGGLLTLMLTDEKIYFVNKQQKKYDIKNPILYEKSFTVQEPINMYKSHIANSKYDRSIGKIFKECEKCKHNLMNYIVLTENNKYIYICNNCNYVIA